MGGQGVSTPFYAMEICMPWKLKYMIICTPHMCIGLILLAQWNLFVAKKMFLNLGEQIVATSISVPLVTFALVSMAQPVSFYYFSCSKTTAWFLKNEFFEFSFDVHLDNFSLLLPEKIKQRTSFVSLAWGYWVFVFIQSPIICSSKIKFCKEFTIETLIADGSFILAKWQTHHSMPQN